MTGTIKDVVNVAALDTGICSNADIDTYIRGDNTYVVMAGQDEAAWTHIDVTDPANPVLLAQYEWIRAAKGTNSPDVKTFHQESNDYIALSTELGGPIGNKGTCGLFIFDVTDPLNAILVSRTFESGVWCSVHNSFVEDGEFLYITANSSADLRVYDISSPASPVKLGTYQRTVRGFGGPGFYDDIYVHDVTVEGGTVYASYWEAGLDILPTSLVTTASSVIDENDISVNIDAPDFAPGRPFLVHHAFPSSNGNLVAFQDEIEITTDSEVVQLWTTSGNHVDSLVQGSDIPVLPSHNLEIRSLAGNRLYVGWYKAGLQAWDFTGGGFISSGTAPRTAVQYHQVQTEAGDNAYDGTWGVRLENIGANTYIFQSDRRFGLIVDCVGCAVAPPTVSSLSPTSGPTAGGNDVVIAGTNLTGATAVTFGGAGASFTVDSPTQITAVAPSHAAGTVDVLVTTPSGTSADTEADDYIYVAPAGGTMHVGDITMSLKKKGSLWDAKAVVPILDGGGAPVSDAAVSVEWSKDAFATVFKTQTKATNGTGTATFQSGRVGSSDDMIYIRVTDVVKTGFDYLPGENGDTTGSILVP